MHSAVPAASAFYVFSFGRRTSVFNRPIYWGKARPFSTNKLIAIGFVALNASGLPKFHEFLYPL